MNLFNCKPSHNSQNFGDELNTWIWPKLIPELLHEGDNYLLVGIGTLLNEWAPKDRVKIVLSAGAGYGNIPELDHMWKIYSVRGPLTAVAAGLSQSSAICDGAILLKRLVNFPSGPNKFKFSFMPHYSSAVLGSESWRLICDELNFGYIDPRWQVEEVLSALKQTEVLISEAMHGAIVADTFRIPWIGVITDTTQCPFKWLDWTMSLEMDYIPQPMMAATNINAKHPSNLQCMQWESLRLIKDRLSRIASSQKPQLSEEVVLESRIQQLESKIEDLKRDLSHESL